MGKDIRDGRRPRDLALHSSGNLSPVLLAMSAAPTVFGLINAAAVAEAHGSGRSAGLSCAARTQSSGIET